MYFRKKANSIFTIFILLSVVTVPLTGFAFFTSNDTTELIPEEEYYEEGKTLEYVDSGNQNSIDDEWDVYVFTEDELTNNETKKLDYIIQNRSNNSIQIDSLNNISKIKFEDGSEVVYNSNDDNMTAHMFIMEDEKIVYTETGEKYKHLIELLHLLSFVGTIIVSASTILLFMSV